MTLIWILALVGCDEYGLDQQAWAQDSGLLTDTAGDLAPLRVDSLSPAAGPTAGGTAVTISGAGFDAGTIVYFGGTDVQTTVIDAGTLAIVTPSAAVETSVDVTISTALGELVLEGGFTYDNDADTDTDTDTGGGGGGTPTGMTAGLVEFWMQAYACPACFGVTDIEQVTASVTRHDPVNGSWLDWLPTTGSCTPNYTPPDLNVTGVSVGDWVYLSTGSSSLSLSASNQSGMLSYAADGLAATDYVTNAEYDLNTSSGDWALDGVLQTTTNFTALQPANILITNPNQAWSEPISASRATFSWAPSGTSADILLLMEVYHPQTFQFMGTILCRSSDTGSLTIPSGSFSSYYAESPVNISIYRALPQQVIDPADGHTIEGLAMYGYIGTGKLVP
ncbi:MAG: hypothetical protein ACI8S6_000795 [Myxococcota bacterium]|jgi:hypothetical protein